MISKKKICVLNIHHIVVTLWLPSSKNYYGYERQNYNNQYEILPTGVLDF